MFLFCCHSCHWRVWLTFTFYWQYSIPIREFDLGWLIGRVRFTIIYLLGVNLLKVEVFIQHIQQPANHSKSAGRFIASFMLTSISHERSINLSTISLSFLQNQDLSNIVVSVTLPAKNLIKLEFSRPWARRRAAIFRMITVSEKLLLVCYIKYIGATQGVC